MPIIETDITHLTPADMINPKLLEFLKKNYYPAVCEDYDDFDEIIQRLAEELKSRSCPLISFRASAGSHEAIITKMKQEAAQANLNLTFIVMHFGKSVSVFIQIMRDSLLRVNYG